MNENKKTQQITELRESNDKKQISMDVDGCTVKLNIPTNKGEAASIETVKRMILNGLAKV